MSKRKRKEAPLLTAILNYLYSLEKTGRILHCDRLNSGKLFIPYTVKSGARRMRVVRLCREGTPDAFCILHEAKMGDEVKKGVVVWIETKAKGYKLRPEQVEFKLKVESVGHAYITAVHIDDVLRALRIMGVKVR